MTDSLSTDAAGATHRQVARTRVDILDGAVRLLERSQEPTVRSVAAEAGVGERTVYRHFESREVLLGAVAEAVTPRLGVPLCASAGELEAYVAALFAVFEANRALTVAMVTSPWCQPWLARSRRSNLGALRALLAADAPNASPEDLDPAAASLRSVLSGAAWVYQRESCDLAPEVVVDNGQWLVRQLRGSLVAGPGADVD